MNYFACIFLWKNGKHFYLETFRKFTVQNKQLVQRICATFLGWVSEMQALLQDKKSRLFLSKSFCLFYSKKKFFL